MSRHITPTENSLLVFTFLLNSHSLTPELEKEMRKEEIEVNNKAYPK